MITGVYEHHPARRRDAIPDAPVEYLRHPRFIPETTAKISSFVHPSYVDYVDVVLTGGGRVRVHSHGAVEMHQPPESGWVLHERA